MDSLYILTQDFNLEGIIDEYVSLIWRPAYNEVGDFEIYLSASPQLVQLLKQNRYVVRSSDIEVTDGVATYRNVMIIKNITLTTDVENGDYINITGRELKYLLHQRIIWSQTNLSGTAEAGLRKLVNDNAINPTDTKRKLPNVVLGASAGLTDTIDKQITGAYLDEAITEICINYNYGWDMFIYNSQIVFIVYQGLDRSYNQTDRPYVIFSPEFDNLYNTSYELNTEAYANTALVGGEGEGTARTYTTINNTYTGLNRYELFVDAKDLSSNKDSDDPTEIISPADYIKLLVERGNEKLAELAYTEGLSGEIIADLSFKYGEDFDLGDVVTVINEYGISANVRVLSCIQSQDENGKKYIPQFNI